jgi:hypothetical protein
MMTMPINSDTSIADEFAEVYKSRLLFSLRPGRKFKGDWYWKNEDGRWVIDNPRMRMELKEFIGNRQSPHMHIAGIEFLIKTNQEIHVKRIQ